MNQLQMVTEVEKSDGQEGAAITFRALADGQPMGKSPEDIACLAGFCASLAGAGRYMLYNCNCGDFGCGGYADGVDVEYLGPTVRLTSADWAHAPVYEFDADQFRRAVEAAVESCRRQLPSVVARVEFTCYDDAWVFGLNPSTASMPRAQQRAFEPGGVFDRHAELMMEWAEDCARRAVGLQSAVEREVRARGLSPFSEPGRAIFQELLGQ